MSWPTEEVLEQILNIVIIHCVPEPRMYHHKMTEQDLKVAEAHDRCRCQTIDNIKNLIRVRRQQLAAVNELSAEGQALGMWETAPSTTAIGIGTDVLESLKATGFTVLEEAEEYYNPVAGWVATYRVAKR